jgi:hypothetical protein
MARTFTIVALFALAIIVAGFIYFSYADGGVFCTVIDGTNPPSEKGFNLSNALTLEELVSGDFIGIRSHAELEEKRKCFARSRKAKKQRLEREEVERWERTLQRNREEYEKVNKKLYQGLIRHPAPNITEEERREQEAQEQQEKLEKLERRVKELEKQIR